MASQNRIGLVGSNGSNAWDPAGTAELLAQVAGPAGQIVVTVGVPMCSDGVTIAFGSGTYDPFDERTLLELPQGLSPNSQADLEFTLDLYRALRAPSAGMQHKPIFTLSVFDTKMVHHIGSAVARNIRHEILADPEAYLPEAARALYRQSNRTLAFDFALDYRKRGDRFVDQMRQAVRPPVPSVPSGRALNLFRQTGLALLKRVGAWPDSEGMGRIVCATPNTTASDVSTSAHHRLDGRSAVRRSLAAIPLTNDNGTYICEVTAIGRVLAMASRVETDPEARSRLVTLSILNVCDPGNQKIHRMSWSAGEIALAVERYLAGYRHALSNDVHMTRVSDESQVYFTSSEEDTRMRFEFLQRLAIRSRKAGALSEEDIIAGQIEGMRSKVERLDPDGAAIVLLFGPGDEYSYQSARRDAAIPDGGCGSESRSYSTRKTR